MEFGSYPKGQSKLLYTSLSDGTLLFVLRVASGSSLRLREVVKVGGVFLALLRRSDFISKGRRERAEAAAEPRTVRLLMCSMVRRQRSTWTNTSRNCLDERL
ncbi:hypothetical protein EYF80_035108 [Liparis tanakae]|uniref:Uncharacterized protein n=1 Tax=Liparis tanakae TaxID=230148 RepID=A0A4Z2GNI2_9TELE|nr:hypothetical protein EYF80_035108 [Liparis tanakae]